MTFTDFMFCGRREFVGFNPSLTLKHNHITKTSSATIQLNPKCEPRNKIPKQNNFSPVLERQKNLQRRRESLRAKNFCPRKYPVRQRRVIGVINRQADW